jgi:ubiquinone/menaquinone biosynthesis C-methylase UbiE
MTQSPLATPVPWNLVAPAYADEVVPTFEKFSTEALRIVAPASGSRVIDVACGPGTLSVLAAQRGCTVDAIDFSEVMIARLQARLASIGLSAVRPQLADGQALPFPDASFEAGFSMFGLMFFPDRAKGFAELRRVLRPGAKALVASWHPMDQIPLFAAMFGAVREAMAKATGAPPQPPVPGSLTTVEACDAEMSASFAGVEVHAFAVTEEAPTADALWESFTRTMAPIVLMKQSLGEKFAAIDEAARAAVRGVVGSGPARVTMTAHLTVGTAR